VKRVGEKDVTLLPGEKGKKDLDHVRKEKVSLMTGRKKGGRISRSICRSALEGKLFRLGSPDLENREVTYSFAEWRTLSSTEERRGIFLLEQ